ncbi:MAG: efflux RND transporter periplasmic adaptor subunit [Flavobacteriaceae bacterium]|nr:efflux RND transporter periplasmic adaptor subunit [Flavobacteriaceae bacterium]
MKNINKMFKISAIFILFALVISCGNTSKNNNVSEAEHGDSHGSNEKESEVSNMVSLTLSQLEVMKIEIRPIESINLGNTLKVNGQLELPPQNMASVSALLGGRVKSVGVIEGDFVKKGQVIARLENPEFIALQQRYLSLKSNLSFLENDYNRKISLAADGITSKKALQKAEADYLEGKSNLIATKSTLQILNVNLKRVDNGNLVSSISVVSPIKGYVQKISINIGKYVSPQQQMFDIIDNDYLHLGLNVFEKDINKAKVGQKITFTLTTQTDKIYNAEIFALGKAFEMDSRSVKVHAKIIGDHVGLLSGMFVEARILTSSKMTKALPNEAFVTDSGLDYIFILKKKDENDAELEKIQVNKGISDLGFSEVVFIKPIPNDALVVVKGAFYVNAELNKGEFEEHEH